MGSFKHTTQYSQQPSSFAANDTMQTKTARVPFGNLTNARGSQVQPVKPGVMTRAQARAMKENQPAQPDAMPVVEVKPEPMLNGVEDAMEEEALAAEVGLISLDPAPLPRHLEDPQEVGVYINDIMRYLSRSESKYMPSASYLKQVQTGLEQSSRATLVDWVINVHRKFKLVAPVLPLAINIMDRFLSMENVNKDKLQLLGAAVLLIASKFEEIYPPEVDDFVHISDKAFKKDAVIQMEGIILNKLKFEISVPTTHAFMSRFVKVASADQDTENLAAYIVDASMMEYSMLKYLPSVIATSAIVLAKKMLGHSTWTKEMQDHTGYTKSALTPCIKDMNQALCRGYHNKMTSLVKKYGDPKYNNITQTPKVEYP